MCAFNTPLGLFYLLMFGGSIKLLEAQKSIISVVAPRVLRPHSEYAAAVSVHGTGSRGDELVTVEVKGRQNDGNLYQKTKSVSIREGSSMLAKIPINELMPGDYNLTVYGAGSLISFRKSTKLSYIPKSSSVFIQLDRSVYKPGITVNFRVIALDSQLRPMLQQPIDILVTDAKGNEVRRWSKVMTHFGCFVGEIPLSINPIFGEWRITATLSEESYFKSFMVAEYILPKFQVLMDLPEHITLQEAESLSVKITARYANGRYVKGELTISAYPIYHTEILQPVFHIPIRRVLPIDGETSVNFNLVKEFGVLDDFQRLVKFEVGVEEAISSSRQNASASILLHKYSYKIDLINSEFYQPGLQYNPLIRVTQFDGSPLGKLKQPVRVKAGFSGEGKKLPESFHHLNEDDLVKLNFDPSINFDSSLEIEAEYPDANKLQAVIYPSQSPSKSYMQVILKSQDPKINEEVQIQILSTVPLPHITYLVLGRGEILYSRTLVPTDPSQTSIQIAFFATRAMAPAARFIAYFVPPGSKEIVANGLVIKFSKTFQNFVKINTSPVIESKPGSEITFTLSAKAYSHMAVMAVDQRALALGKDYDISSDKILEDMNAYFGIHESIQNAVLTSNKFYKDPSVLTQDVFSRFDTVILTSGEVNSNQFTSMQSGELPQFGATRPPLAGPFAFSRIPAPSWDYRPRVHLIEDLADTWIFTNISSGPDGKVTLKRTLPENMTTWLVSAFSLDPVHGIGVLSQKVKIIGKKSFYIDVDFPSPVILGEIVSISVAISNFMSQELSADVVLENGERAFHFVENGGKELRSIPQKKRAVFVKPSSTVITVFMIIPKQIGLIDVNVKASFSSLRETKSHKLIVKAEGETIYENKAVLIDLRNSKSFYTNFSVNLPKYFVEDSELITVSAVGDLLGNTISNLGKLIRLPMGCGEQNMAKLVPNIAILEYLKNTKQLTKAIENKAIEHIEIGYQQQLSYLRSDGSFSAFGPQDLKGSVWLTAYVAKYINQAFIVLDKSRGQPLLLRGSQKIVEEAFEWLKSVQAPNGSFPELGTITYEDMQGTRSSALPLTAFTLLSFIDNQKYQRKPVHQNAVNKALDYIARNLEEIDDPYAMSLCTYALHVAKHPAKETAFHLLESMSKTKGEMKWWQKEITLSESKNTWINTTSRSANVEMSAYAMLVYLDRGLVQDALPIANWLLNHQNSLGGFASTQDTVIGIYALASLAEVLQTSDVDVTINFSHAGKETIHITNENALVLQRAKVPNGVKEISVEAHGRGIALVQMSYQYNLNVTGAWPLFSLDPQVDKNSNVNHLQLSVCSGYVGGNVSNMALMEVFLPSGFYVDQDSLPSLRVTSSVKRVETYNDGTSVALYFDQMMLKEYCPTISAYRTHGVAWNRPVPVIVYDFYDMSRKARVFYKPVKSNPCDLCYEDRNESSCLLSCGISNQPQEGESESNKSDSVKSKASSDFHIPVFASMVASFMLQQVFMMQFCLMIA